MRRQYVAEGRANDFKIQTLSSYHTHDDGSYAGSIQESPKTPYSGVVLGN